MWAVFTAVLVVQCTLAHYKVTNSALNESSVQLELTYTGSDTYYLKETSPILKKLMFALQCHTASDISFKITDPEKTRFEVPQTGIFPKDPSGSKRFPLKSSLFEFAYTENPFTFTLLRRDDNTVLFNTTTGQLIYSEHYIELTSIIPSRFAYGLGERFADKFRIHPGKYTIFNRDRPFSIDRNEGLQTYGHYPIYFLREGKGNFHINYLRNSNAMDVIVEDSGIDKYSLTYKVIGGIFDFRLFLGNKDADKVISRLHEYAGPSMIPPFWAMGFHQCRWGYRNVGYLEDVIRNYQDNNIPLDTIWTDIDYMWYKEDFTVDDINFNLDRMKVITDNYHYIPIIDAGIKDSGYAYQEGVKRDIFIKNANGSIYIGKVWPGTTAFVDFFHPNASKYWQDMLNILYDKVKFSGIWLDMNEIANFCDGNCFEDSPTPIFDYRHQIPYHPGRQNIETNTISLNTTHHGGITEANVHSFFGFMESEATYSFLKNKGLRPFIITRSSSLGTNKYAGHWTGDNSANFDFLRSGIYNNFMFQIWGVQMVGDDICGFGGNTNEELCARWFQLGSLAPFSRNHNIFEGISQEAYALGDKVKEAARTNLRLRYSLLKFYYRHFIIRKGQGLVYRPLFADFPTDDQVFVDEVLETQFIIGKEIMVTPILHQRQNSRTVYFPQGAHWYDFYSGKRQRGGTVAQITNDFTEAIPMFLQEGTGVIVQDASRVHKTKDLNNQFTIKAALKRTANGPSSYEATIGMLSIKDFANDTLVDQCLAHGCDYTINLMLTVGSHGKIVKIEVQHNGSQELRQQQFIVGLVLYYEDGKATIQLRSPLQISNTDLATIEEEDGNEGAIEKKQEEVDASAEMQEIERMTKIKAENEAAEKEHARKQQEAAQIKARQEAQKVKQEEAVRKAKEEAERQQKETKAKQKEARQKDAREQGRRQQEAMEREAKQREAKQKEEQLQKAKAIQEARQREQAEKKAKEEERKATEQQQRLDNQRKEKQAIQKAKEDKLREERKIAQLKQREEADKKKREEDRLKLEVDEEKERQRKIQQAAKEQQRINQIAREEQQREEESIVDQNESILPSKQTNNTSSLTNETTIKEKKEEWWQEEKEQENQQEEEQSQTVKDVHEQESEGDSVPSLIQQAMDFCSKFGLEVIVGASVVLVLAISIIVAWRCRLMRKRKNLVEFVDESDRLPQAGNVGSVSTTSFDNAIAA